MPTLVFGFTTGAADYNYLDEVSVVDNNASSIQLLNNPSFENSTTNITGWTTWCTSSCGAVNATKITNSDCHNGKCVVNQCQHPAYDYLVQSFPATIGDTYTISFWLQQNGTGTLRFYAAVES